MGRPLTVLLKPFSNLKGESGDTEKETVSLTAKLIIFVILLTISISFVKLVRDGSTVLVKVNNKSIEDSNRSIKGESR